MLKEYSRVLRRLQILADACVVVAGFFLAYFLRSKIYGGIAPLASYYWLLPFLLLIWLGMLYFFGLYKSFRVKDAFEITYIILKTAFFALIFLPVLLYFLKIEHISRGFISLLFICIASLLCLEKIILIHILRGVRKKGYNFRNVVLVGTNKRAQNFMQLISEHSEWGMRIIGLIDEDASKIGQEVNGAKVLGNFNDVSRIIHDNVVDEVVFVVPRSWLDRIQDLIYLCEIEGIRASVAVDFYDMKFARAKQTDLHGFPLLSFDSAPDKIWQLMIKRWIDIIGSGLGLLFLSPLFLTVAILIKSSSKGPVFFNQERSGLNGRKFPIYKFRTMYEGAEAKQKELLEHNKMQGPVFKMANDPRIAPIGKWLRKFSVDELPQLWNVFIGDMSLVGPRPPMPSEVKQYDNWHRRRLSMRPGITCLWQARGRNKITDFDEWMRLDLEYIDNWSLFLDFKLLFETMPIVFLGIGAE